MASSPSITAWLRSPGLLIGKDSSLDPRFAVRADLFLPDRDLFFESVDRVLAGFEGELAVRRADGDHDAWLANSEATDAVGHRHALDSPTLTHSLGNLGHLGLRHLGERL